MATFPARHIFVSARNLFYVPVSDIANFTNLPSHGTHLRFRHRRRADSLLYPHLTAEHRARLWVAAPSGLESQFLTRRILLTRAEGREGGRLLAAHCAYTLL